MAFKNLNNGQKRLLADTYQKVGLSALIGFSIGNFRDGNWEYIALGLVVFIVFLIYALDTIPEK